MTAIEGTQAVRQEDPATLSPDRNTTFGPEPSREETQRFQQRIREGQTGQEEDSSDEACAFDAHGNAREDGSLSELMSRLFRERQGLAPTPAVAPPEEAAGVERLENTLERLVQHILVSHPERAETQEVRLILEEKLLPDTEIHLLRDPDGLLRVTLASGNANALQTLIAAQNDLKERLGAHEHQGVRISVREIRAENSSEQTDDASGRRSATYRAHDAHGEENA